MPELSGPYDSYLIQPVAQIKQNLSVWTLGRWSHFKVIYQEGISPGPASTVETVTASGATALAAGAAIAKRIVVILQINDLEFLHLRWEPLDNVEGLIWEQSGQQKLTSRNIHSRVDRNTRNWDPNLGSTTFFILGQNRDMNLEVRNPMQYPIPAARFVFWGNRSILEPWDFSEKSAVVKSLLAEGDVKTVREVIGQTTWVPVEGRQA